jgi:hypothetical protein
VCTKIEGKEKLLVPKLDNFFKHGGRRKVVATILSVCKTREFYVNEEFIYAKSLLFLLLVLEKHKSS